jgi:predicted transcriptional regulator
MSSPRREEPRPTNAELDILRVLWKQGPSTVRQVHRVLTREKNVAYTTVLTFLQIMLEKGLVNRDATPTSHVYRAILSEKKAQRRLFDEFLKRVFGGSSHKLVLHVLAHRKATREEIREIKVMLEKLEGTAE